MAPIVMHPPAELEAHPGDVPDDVVLQVLERLSFLKDVKSKPNLSSFPNTLKIRRFSRGDVLCQQGEAGWTAFIILPREDVLLILQTQRAQARSPREQEALDREIAAVQEQLGRLAAEGADQEHPDRIAATVRIRLSEPAAKQRGALGRFLDTVLRRGRTAPRSSPRSIPIDGPAYIPYQTRQVPLYEGELVGELSCLYGTPRSAMIVAERPCYVVEMLRNILDKIRNDKNFAARMDEVYLRRVLKNHLRGMDLFRDLSDEMFALIRDRVELIRLRDGDVICDEHDKSDAVYIVRNGLVRVLQQVSSLLRKEDVTDPATLARRIREAAASPQGVASFLVSRLPGEWRQKLLDPRREGPRLVSALRDGLNALIKDPLLPAAPEIQEAAKQAGLAEKANVPDARPGEWAPLTKRRFNRYLLESVFEGCLTPLRLRAGPEVILNYLSRGDIIGEMGVLQGTRRSATCVAYVMPPSATTSSEYSKVKYESTNLIELVRIPGDVFQEIIIRSPSIRQRVNELVKARLKDDTRRREAEVGDLAATREQSKRFTELGLVQGQRLMLIDLNRCTRCDECVRACVNTHDDGNTRLHLVGPRYGDYLVPSTCRACRDPLCLIGCPVGSIHRGGNGEIIIEDWCIGCSLCAKNCPYGSIQMHDVGIIPEASHEWRYRLADLADARDTDWVRPRFNDTDWALGSTPFMGGGAFRTGPGRQRESDAEERLLFLRHSFHIPSATMRGAKQFIVEAASVDPEVCVWVNGQLLTDRTTKRGTHTYTIPPGPPLQTGWNLIAVRAKVAPGRLAPGELVFHLRLDDEKLPRVSAGEQEQFREKMVTMTAVVCDLCSSLSSQQPVCVKACPHDAAMRVDALTQFPE